MMTKAGTWAVGLLHKCGWMTLENLMKGCFKENLICENDQSVALVIDNHDSHIVVEDINFCWDNGITIFTLPPHDTLNRREPLDHCVFQPFKKCFGAAVQRSGLETLQFHSLLDFKQKQIPFNWWWLATKTTV